MEGTEKQLYGIKQGLPVIKELLVKQAYWFLYLLLYPFNSNEICVTSASIYTILNQPLTTINILYTVFYCMGTKLLLMLFHRSPLNCTTNQFGPAPLQLCGRCWLFTKFTQRWKYSFSTSNLQLPHLSKAKSIFLLPYLFFP